MAHSANSLDYEEIDRETYGSLKRSSLYVKSIADQLNAAGLPEAIWQVDGQTLNIYNHHTPSEMGFSMRKKRISQEGSIHESDRVSLLYKCNSITVIQSLAFKKLIISYFSSDLK